MKIALIRKKNHNHFNTDYFSPQYSIFRNGLTRYDGIQFTDLATDDPVSHSDINRFDAIILPGLRGDKVPPLYDLDASKIPTFVCTHDCHNITDQFTAAADYYKIKNFFYHHPESYFRKFAPASWNYHRIIMCVDRSIDYEKKLCTWKNRIVDRLLVTGSMYDCDHYKLRRIIAKKQYSWFVPRGKHFSGVDYYKLLGSFRASVAACGTVTVNKLFESMVSGCLTFVETNDSNGWDELGLTDQNCVPITEYNYDSQIMDYVDNPNDPKWKTIADNGRTHALQNYNIDIQIKKFVEWMKQCM